MFYLEIVTFKKNKDHRNFMQNRKLILPMHTGFELQLIRIQFSTKEQMMGGHE